MQDCIFLLPEAPAHLQKTQSYIVSNQRKSIGITNFVFGSIILIEIAFIIADAVQKNIFRGYFLVKVIINLLSLISLTILFKSLGRNTSKTKNYVAYVISWILIINEVWSEYYGTYYYEDDGESFPIFASVAAFKIVILQILILSLTINNILKLLPLMCMGTLGLVVISLYLVSLRFLLETIVCLLATIFLGFLLIKREEFLCKAISAGAEELTFHKNIAQTVPIGILLTDRSYQTIYQNNQMQNYFDTLPANLRNPLNLFRQFKGAEVSEEGLVTLIKDAINQRLDGYSSNTMDEVCLEDALDILFKHYKVVENALKGSGTSTTTMSDSLSSSIKFYMKNIDTIIEVQVSPIKVGNRECALLLFSDHTEKLSPILGGDESTQYLFLASLSHELKTPLNSALALLQSSLQEHTIPEDLKQKLLVPALNSIKILSYNVKDLIDYSKISCGSLGLRLENCNIPSLIERTIKLVDLQANKKKISIFSKIDPEIPKEWCSDPERVCQALLNLLSNGLKYTVKGFMVVSAKYLDKRGLIKIKVTDTGVGMEKKDLIKLQRFLRNQDISPKKLNLHSTGIGMGLTVSNEICSILGPPKYDYLRVKSSPNRGSEFTFYIENKTKAHSSIEGNIAIETHESLLSEASNLKQKQLSKKITKNRHTTRKESIFSPHRAQRVEREKTEKAFQSKETDIIDLNDDKPDDSLDASSDSSPSLYANTSLLSQRYSSFETNKKSRNPSILKQGSSKKSMKLKRQESERLISLERVLIVDDDSFNILSLELMFKTLKIPHDHAYNGQEAIQKVLTNKYDLIMMDCNMPVMDGWEATKNILDLIKEGKVNDTLIVACTAFEDAENLLKCCEAGMKYIIQKPVNQEKLSDLLRRLSA